MIEPPATPRNMLKPYQRRWADDTSRWKFGLMARQTGKDFCSAEEGVRDCFMHEQNGGKTTWLIAAPSERQSNEALAKWKEWTEAYKLAEADILEERFGGPETLLKSVTIIFPRGSRVIAVPGRPDTVRGYSANVLLTEFAFFENPEQTWRAIVPAVTNPLRGGVKKVRLITTPNGIGNKAHEIWSKNYNQQRWGETPSNPKSIDGSIESRPTTPWSCHFVDIYNRVTTASGGVTYRAPHSADGHADRCTALALALRARQEKPSCGPIFLFPHPDNRVNTSLFQ